MNPKHISGEPAKRSDNRYECNHTCKDKKKCRHLWYVLTATNLKVRYNANIAVAMDYHTLQQRKIRSLLRTSNQYQRQSNSPS